MNVICSSLCTICIISDQTAHSMATCIFCWSRLLDRHRIGAHDTQRPSSDQRRGWWSTASQRDAHFDGLDPPFCPASSQSHAAVISTTDRPKSSDLICANPPMPTPRRNVLPDVINLPAPRSWAASTMVQCSWLPRSEALHQSALTQTNQHVASLFLLRQPQRSRHTYPILCFLVFS